VNGSKMLKEIREQPEVLERVLDEGWGEVHEAAGELRSRGFRCAMLAARGTSDNAALYAKYLFEVILGVPTALASPSAFTLYESKMKLDDVLHLKDITLPAGVKALQDEDLIIATCAEIKEAESTEAAEADSAEPEVIGKKKEDGEEGDAAAAPAPEKK